MDCDSTPPPQGSEPLRSRSGSLHPACTLAGGADGLCAVTSTWVPPITAGCCRGQPTNIIHSSSFLSHHASHHLQCYRQQSDDYKGSPQGATHPSAREP